MTEGDGHYTHFWRQPRTGMAYRTGLVVQQQFTPWPAVRVQFPDRDNIQSFWLNIATRGSQDDKDFWMPDIGEQVCVLMDVNDENGTVLGTQWSTADTVSGGNADVRFTQFKDGTLIKYDRAAHAYTISLGQVGTITLETPSGNKILWDSSGNINLTTGSGQLINCSQGGQAVADALVLVSKFLAQFNAHTHGGVQAGQELSGPPAIPLVASDVESALVKTSN